MSWLPQQPLDPTPPQQALTYLHLEPEAEAIAHLWRAARVAVDPQLAAAKSVKSGKPYPLGQCLEISQAVLSRLRLWLEPGAVPALTGEAAAGLTRLRTFLAAGGELRLVWGVLRERYFQNALQLGAWYVDVANDTVDPAKPPVEILPFADSGLVAVADFAHFARIARAYWSGAIYPNHLFPALAPWFPLISDVEGAGLRLQVGNDYMIALARRNGFAPARAALSEGEVPESVIQRIAAVLKPGELGFDPSDGRVRAFARCDREQRIPEADATRHRDDAVARYLDINRRLAGAPPAAGFSSKGPGPATPTAHPVSASELIRTAEPRLRRDPEQAATDFAAALRPGCAVVPPPNPLERVRLGLCLGLAQFHLNEIPASLATTESALRLAATLPWPVSAPRPPIPFDATTAGRLLEEALVDLCQAGFHAFAAGGALLGLVREGRLMDHDKDVDVVVPIEEFARACDHLARQDWQPAWIPIAARNLRAFVHRRSGLTLDLFGYDFDAEGLRVLGGWWPPDQSASEGRLLVFSHFTLVRRSSPSGPLWAIDQPEQYLAELYGPGWCEPDPDYEALFDTPALACFNPYTRALCYLRLLEAWNGGRRERMQRLLAVLHRRAPENPIPRVFATPEPAVLAKRAACAAPGTAPVIGGALGVFDLVHVGHLRFLRDARARCDRLKVGVCTERTARNSKGRMPVLPLEQRIEMLGALRCVDEVCTFDGALADTQAAADWIQAWGVQRMFVSQDWAGSKRWLALEPELRARGILCLWLPSTPGISTSAIREWIMRAHDRLPVG